MGYEVTAAIKEERVSPKEDLEGFLLDCVDKYPKAHGKGEMADWGIDFINGVVTGTLASAEWEKGQLHLNEIRENILARARRIDGENPGIDCEGQVKRTFFGAIAEVGVYQLLSELKDKKDIILGFSLEEQQFDPKKEFEKAGSDAIFFLRVGTTLYGLSVKSYYGDVIDPKVELFDLRSDTVKLASRVAELQESGQMRKEIEIANRQEDLRSKAKMEYQSEDVVQLVLLVNRHTIDEDKGVFYSSYKEQIRQDLEKLGKIKA